jgi:hypothetical protein
MGPGLRMDPLISRSPVGGGLPVSARSTAATFGPSDVSVWDRIRVRAAAPGPLNLLPEFARPKSILRAAIEEGALGVFAPDSAHVVDEGQRLLAAAFDGSRIELAPAPTFLPAAHSSTCGAIEIPPVRKSVGRRDHALADAEINHSLARRINRARRRDSSGFAGFARVVVFHHFVNFQKIARIAAGFQCPRVHMA